MDQPMPDLNQTLLDLNQKIEALTCQVAYLTEQARISERNRQVVTDLMDTMMPVAKDAMRIASDQFEPVQDYLQIEDLLRFMVKMARHRPLLETMIDGADAFSDLVHIMDPVLKGGTEKLVSVLTELEQKGYFNFAHSGMRLVDNVVTSFSEDDVDRLGDNVVLILNTVKDMTQPEIMTFVRNTLQVAEREVEKPVNTSLGALLGQMNDPAVRRGLALTLRVLRVVGQQAEPKPTNKN